MQNVWQRFTHWLANANDYGSVLEGLSGVVMLVITIALVRQTKESMKAAVESARASEAAARAAKQQVELMVYPNMDLSLPAMTWSEMSVGKEFSVTAIIKNRGSFAVRINKAFVSWQTEETLEPRTKNVPIRHLVIPPGQERLEKISLFKDSDYEIDFEPSFFDFIRLSVECSDLSAMNTCTFDFSRAELLRHHAGSMST